MHMCQLFLKLSSVLKLLILTAKLLVKIKTQNFYSCLILTENFVVSIESFHPLLILTTEIPVNIKVLILTGIIVVTIKTFKLNIEF